MSDYSELIAAACLFVGAWIGGVSWAAYRALDWVDRFRKQVFAQLDNDPPAAHFCIANATTDPMGDN